MATDDAEGAAAAEVVTIAEGAALDGLRSRLLLEEERGAERAEEAARPSAVVGVVGVPSPARAARPQNLSTERREWEKRAKSGRGG